MAALTAVTFLTRLARKDGPAGVYCQPGMSYYTHLLREALAVK